MISTEMTKAPERILRNTVQFYMTTAGPNGGPAESMWSENSSEQVKCAVELNDP